VTFDADLATLLRRYLPGQRWFAGRGRPLRAVAVELAPGPVRAGDPLHAVARVDYDDGGQPERYQVPLGLGPGPGEQLGAVAGDGGPVEVRDAMGDPGLVLRLLGRIAAGDCGGGGDGGPRFRHAGDPAALRAQSVRPLGAEQSNTSVVLDDRLILKLFRRLQPGVNPELEVTAALAAQGFGSIAEPLGWMEAADGTTLAVVQPFLAGGVEGWALATRRSGAYRSGDDRAGFDGEARALGEVTAALHRALAAAFGTSRAGPEALDAEREGRLAELDEAVTAVPALRAFRDRIAVLYHAARTTELDAALQRVHGDYHLGQVLRTADGRWVVLDFEGEPARPLAVRRRPASPLRDVAGMLRSVDYAASFPPAGEDRGEDEAARRAAGWAARARAAFLAGYAGGRVDGRVEGRAEGAALRGFELEKAVYEVTYEARYRPGWLAIPLGGIARLVGATGETARRAATGAWKTGS
jgi:maltokinase